VATGEALLSHFSEEEKRNREKWRATEERLTEQRKSVLADTLIEQQNLFVDLAKTSMLCAEDVLTSTYTLFGDDEALRFFRGIILRTHGRERITAHNFYVASRLPPSFLATFGELLIDDSIPAISSRRTMLSDQSKTPLHEGREAPQGAGIGN